MKQTIEIESNKTSLYRNLDLYNYAINKRMQKRWKIYNMEKELLRKLLSKKSEKIRNGIIEILDVGEFKNINNPKKLIKLL